MSADRRELLRFLTAGSVDDGKSTLIGRLLHDASAIYHDQFEAVQTASARSLTSGIDFSLVTDGLRAEREQGITIDVAYRYFATARRKFIVADSPGHEQYTRNMATGASTAQLAVLLIDARKGVLPQTHRHTVIAWFLGIRSFTVVVNKMDLVDFRADVFAGIRADFTAFLSRLGHATVQFIPCCSPRGDNVVLRSQSMPWYSGPPLLEHLETTPVAANHTGAHLRLPVQSLVRANGGERYYAGQIASGSLQPGDRVLAMPSGQIARVAAITLGNDPVESAAAPLSVAVRLDRELDIGRGDMLVDPDRAPTQSRRFNARLLWTSREPLGIDRPYLIKHASRYVCASIVRLIAVIDPTTLDRHAKETITLNEFAEVEIATHHPLYADPYDANRATGSFIVVDPTSNETVAAGMILDDVQETLQPRTAPSVSTGMTVWFTGLSSAGKSTISRAVYEKLWAQGLKVELLDGDLVRQHISKDLGFSKEDRDENIRRIAFMAEALTRHGVVALVAAISPYRQLRDEARARIGNFIEVFVNAPMDVLEQRDIKGLYRRARAGEIHGVSGVDDPYEPPLAPEVECLTDRESLAESVTRVIGAVQDRLTGPASPRPSLPDPGVS